jgi:cyclic pyranopterin monophosphate synthase
MLKKKTTFKVQSTHFDNKGAAKMVDVSNKKVSTRVASAEAIIVMKPATLSMIIAGNHKKGDVLAVARIAGILGAKKTSDLIPLCHPIGIETVEINFQFDKKNNTVNILSICKTTNKTGIEIEAMTAASLTALTIYDMCKSVDREMYIKSIKLTHKSGGKSGIFNRV